ncbi:Protein MGARP, partial [Dissostichus eleginoides]
HCDDDDEELDGVTAGRRATRPLRLAPPPPSPLPLNCGHSVKDPKRSRCVTADTVNSCQLLYQLLFNPTLQHTGYMVLTAIRNSCAAHVTVKSNLT